jgi:HupE / UreJ protein
MKTLLSLAVAGLIVLGLNPSAWAHKSSDAYIQMQRTDAGLNLRVDVALRDLDVPLDLDGDGDAQLTWAEVKTAWPAIQTYVLTHVKVAGCALNVSETGLERRTDGAYAVLHLASTCRPTAPPPLRYTLLRDVDTTHRGLLKVQWGAAPAQLAVLDPAQPAAPGSATGEESPAIAAPGAAPAVGSFFAEGIHHIVTGYDHVLFLVCLLLPSVMRRAGQGWRPVERMAHAVLPVVGVVTAFTVAHSITLTLAALKWVAIPPSIVEPAIAATIVLAALDNLYPLFRGRRVLVTFAFGLIHGFGFAGVLGELNLETGQFAWALLQFNLGLEFGQLAIVVAVAAALYALRRQAHYPAWAIRGGSFAAIMVGLLWFVERTADVTLLAWQ